MAGKKQIHRCFCGRKEVLYRKLWWNGENYILRSNDFWLCPYHFKTETDKEYIVSPRERFIWKKIYPMSSLFGE